MSSLLKRAHVLTTRALARWGFDKQADMVHEETAELNLALARYKRGRGHALKVLDEAADCIIVSVQASVLVGATPDDLFERVAFKLDRLEERVNLNAHNGGTDE